MKTFTPPNVLDKLVEHDPARPAVRQLLDWLIAQNEWPDSLLPATAC